MREKDSGIRDEVSGFYGLESWWSVGREVHLGPVCVRESKKRGER